MTELSPEILRLTGTEIRDTHTDIIGECYSISQELQTVLNNRFNVHLDIIETRVGELRDTHYVLKLAGTNFTAHTDGDILIDATLDQFCTENQHHDDVRVDFGRRSSLPSVAIYLPNAEERCVWYYRPNDPTPGTDVFTGTKEYTH